MEYRRARASALLAILPALLLLTGCEPEQGGGKHRAPEAPPKAAVPPKAVDPGVNQPGPQADPGQCNERGKRQVELQAHWSSEVKDTPSAAWTKNGVSTPFTNLSSHANGPGRGYSGEKSQLVDVQCRDILSVNVKGTRSTFATICVIIDLGQDIVQTGGRDCAATYKVP